MIPTDVVSQSRLSTDLDTAPVVPVSRIKDVLSDMQPGQRVMAEIQALLPNGTYRAIVAQRDVVLSLPHSANTGDRVELEVVENNGHLVLALLAEKSGGLPRDAITLSQTALLIRNLLTPSPQAEKKMPGVPLALPPAGPETFDASAETLSGRLQAAVSQSGLFYESHLAAWAQGNLPAETIRQEPQGQIRPIPLPTDAPRDNSPVLPDLSALVQQQLETLATQRGVWHGEIWPGQTMEWAIADESPSDHSDQSPPPHLWKSDLSLTLPQLGKINARVQLHGGQITIGIEADLESTVSRLSRSGNDLNEQMKSAGLSLTAFGVHIHANEMV